MEVLSQKPFRAQLAQAAHGLVEPLGAVTGADQVAVETGLFGAVRHGGLPHQSARNAVEVLVLNHHHAVDDADQRVDVDRVILEGVLGWVRSRGDIEGLHAQDGALVDEALAVVLRGLAYGGKAVAAGPHVVDAFEFRNRAERGAVDQIVLLRKVRVIGVGQRLVTIAGQIINASGLLICVRHGASFP